MKEGFWVLFWMESGRGHTVREETYVFLKYEDGYAEKDKEILRSDVRDWCQYDKQGCDLDSYHYGFEVVAKPPNTWLENELKKLRSKYEQIIRQENLIKSELRDLDPTTPYIGFSNESLKDAEEIKAGDKAPCPKCGELVLVEESNPPMLQCITHCGSSWLVGVDGKYVGNRHPDVSGKI